MMLNRRIPRSSSESGYSLAEMLVVVALIGIVSLVSIPNFMALYRTSKMKASLRQFSTELRALRARAASRNLRQKISFDAVDNTTRSYQTFEFRDTDNDGNPDDWVQFSLPNPKPCDDDPNSQCLDETVYFNSTTFEDSDEDEDELPEIVFLSNGTISPYPAGAGEVVLRTDSLIAVNQYTIELNASGRVKVTEGSF